MSNVIAFPAKAAHGADNPMLEATAAHDDALADLEDAVEMYARAGDHKMAQACSAHLHRLRALRARR
jgi:hypothetical protein